MTFSLLPKYAITAWQTLTEVTGRKVSETRPMQYLIQKYKGLLAHFGLTPSNAVSTSIQTPQIGDHA